MADLRNDPAFAGAVEAARAGITILAARNVRDARAITDRLSGWNNLQGHAHSIVPLGVVYARAHPNHIRQLRASTALVHGMGTGSAEARDQAIWRPIMNGMRRFLAARGGDIVSEEIGTRTPQSCQDIANTYLGTQYGGSHPLGGAGNTVLKRTLKLLAHLQNE